MAHETSTTTHTTNKRKRGNLDTDAPRPGPGYTRSTAIPSANEGAPEMEYDDAGIHQLIAHNQDQQPNGGNNSSASDTATAALTHYQVAMGGTEDPSFQSQGSAADTSFNMPNSVYGMDMPGKDVVPANPSPIGDSRSKPQVGSDEWHKVRRDNHKEVERRRRETINEGINELQKIVPGCEKNKGSILQRAHQYIAQLKDNEQQNIEKWTLEKLLLDQAINELSNSCDKLKGDYQKVWEEKEKYKRACELNNIVPIELRDQQDGSAE